MTDARASQSAMLVLSEMGAPIRDSQGALLVLAQMLDPMRVSQAAMLLLGDYAPCHTRRAQLWKITRRDGTVFGFTGHDESITFGGVEFTPCNSLDASASQQAADVEGIGNVELSGIISDDAIREQDIEAGLFDDAYVEVYLVAWAEPTQGGVSVDSVRRLVAGWVGEMSVGERGFRAEVLGPGQRLAQKALLDVYGPGCRFTFGDAATCGVDIDAMKLPATVTQVTDNGRFLVSIGAVTGGAQYDQGFVRWLTGANAGVDSEVKTVEFPTGDAIVTLWAVAPFAPAIGDTLEVFPGCDRSATTCKFYDNFPNFGGFDKVPGNDAIVETPDAKY